MCVCERERTLTPPRSFFFSLDINPSLAFDAIVTVGAAAAAAAAVAERRASISQLKMLLNRKTFGIFRTKIPFDHMTF